MPNPTHERIAQIRKRFDEYQKHKNDDYAYWPEEIVTTKALLDNAPNDIEFLLEALDTLLKTSKV